MGNGPSNSRRNGRIQQNPVLPPPPPRMVPPPPGYPGNHHAPPYPANGQHHLNYFNPPYYNGAMNAPMGPPLYPSGYVPTNGQFMMSLQAPGFRPVHPNPPPSHTPPPTSESQKMNTIRNDVNLKKTTLRLEKDEENPGFHLVAFTFDATVAGSISIFLLAKEEENCGFTPLKPELFSVTRVPFKEGLGQKFQQEPGTGINLAMFDERDLSKDGDDGIYPLVVRAETVAKGHANVALQEEPIIGAPLPEWIHSQTTMAVIEKKDDGSPKVRVTRQTIWVEGTQYVLQEIYGIENSGGGGSFDGSDSGKECVICMSEPRDTMVLPCRHMCMCSDCAKVLKFQTNRCPICRTPVEQFREINVLGASASQGSYPNLGQSSAGSRVKLPEATMIEKPPEG